MARTMQCKKCGADLGEPGVTESCWGWCSKHDPDLSRHLPADEDEPRGGILHQPGKAGGPRIKIPATRMIR